MKDLLLKMAFELLISKVELEKILHPLQDSVQKVVKCKVTSQSILELEKDFD
jgi:hypothetical protein